MNGVTLDQAIDAAMQLSLEQQEMLLGILRGRLQEARRQEVACLAQESIAAYQAGELKAQPAEKAIRELRESLETGECEGWFSPLHSGEPIARRSNATGHRRVESKTH